MTKTNGYVENTSRKLVSIIVPVYNVEPYIRRCLDSLVNQTYKYIEIIVVDDGSNDCSYDICYEYTLKHNNVFVFSKKNGGLSDARNVGLSKAHGEVIGFVDSDDWVRVDMYSQLMYAMQLTDADIVCCGYANATSNVIQESIHTGQIERWSKEMALFNLCGDCTIQSHAWDKIFRRELFDGIEFPKGKYYEDVYIMHRVFDRGKRFAYVDIPFYYYFQRQDSITREASWKNVEDYIDSRSTRCIDLIDQTKDVSAINAAETRMIGALLDGVALSVGFPHNREYRVRHKEMVGALRRFKLGLTFQLSNPANQLEFICYKLHVPMLYYAASLSWNTSMGYKIENFAKSKYRRFAARHSYQNRQHDNLIHLSQTSQSEEPRLVLMGSPEYSNFGDLAIARATKAFVEDILPDVDYCEVTEDDIRFNMVEVARNIHKNDVLLLQGGGNLNELYDDQRIIREKVIDYFPHNKIVIMPQSFITPVTNKGVYRMKALGRMMSRHGDVKLFARDVISQEQMSDFFGCPVGLSPDMVFGMRVRLADQSRHGIGICLRRDIESNLTEDQRTQIIYQAREHTNDIQFVSTIGAGSVRLAERDSEIDRLLEEFSVLSLVITDRLHGVIFCAVTGTPCIAVPTNNSKISGAMDWLKGCQYILCCQDIKQIGELCKELLDAGGDAACSPDLSDSFVELKTVVKSKI